MKYFENVFTALSSIVVIISLLWFANEKSFWFPDFIFYPIKNNLDNMTMDLLGTLALILAPFFSLMGGAYAFHYNSKNNDWPLKVTLATLALVPFGYYGFFVLLFIF